MDSGEWRENMRLGAGDAHDISDLVAARSQRIGNQRTMAVPRNCLGTHDGSRLLLCEFEEPFQSRRKGRCLHVVMRDGSTSDEIAASVAGVEREFGRLRFGLVCPLESASSLCTAIGNWFAASGSGGRPHPLSFADPVASALFRIAMAKRGS